MNWNAVIGMAGLISGGIFIGYGVAAGYHVDTLYYLLAALGIIINTISGYIIGGEIIE